MVGELWENISSAAMVATAFLQIVFMWIAYEKISEFLNQHEGAYTEENMSDIQLELVQEEKKNVVINEQILMSTNLYVMWKKNPCR